MSPPHSLSTVERFSTPFFSAKANLRLWNEVAEISSAGLTIDAASAGFRGDLYRWRLGDITLLWPHATESVVRRRPTTGGEERLLVHLQGRGECLQQQGARQCRLRPGDLSLCTSELPSELRTTTHDMLVIDLPTRHLQGRVTNLDHYLARIFPSHSPSVQAFRRFLTSTWQDGIAANAQANAAWQHELHQCIVSMLVLILRGADHDVPAPSGFDRIARIVGTRFHDPALSGQAIADELGVSLRTVQMWLAANGWTPRNYVAARRMEAAAQMLVTSPQTSISAIAFDCGFEDIAHFSRSFRRHFGMPPRQWRITGGARVSAH